jgi:L-aspartate oxidase
MKNNHVTIVGSGIAGLSLAIKLAELRKDITIVIYTKADSSETNTRYAQGGIAGVFDLDSDSFQSHIDDTLKACGNTCNSEIVKKVVESAPERIRDLENWGVVFSKNKLGNRDTALEGGHSKPRVIHSKDSTGSAVEDALLLRVAEFNNIFIFNHLYVVEIIKERSRICGLKLINTKSNTLFEVATNVVVLSTGGCGQLFKYTTNPRIATGDGIILANTAGATVSGMNHIQFHPTAFFEHDKSPLFLISEAVRGEGAHIVNENGKRFVFADDSRGELATRDIVTRSILKELIKSRSESVFLDARHIENFSSHFPMIFEYCQKKKLNIAVDLIPIVPAAHYQCGGIDVDEFGETNVDNLFAIGECSNTGMHGSNRLASNSLLEAIAFAHFSANKIATLDFHNTVSRPSKYEKLEKDYHPIYALIQLKLQTIMYQFGMIGASKQEVCSGIKKIKDLENEFIELFTTKSFSLCKWKLLNSIKLSLLILTQMQEEIKIKSNSLNKIQS